MVHTRAGPLQQQKAAELYISRSVVWQAAEKGVTVTQEYRLSKRVEDQEVGPIGGVERGQCIQQHQVWHIVYDVEILCTILLRCRYIFDIRILTNFMHDIKGFGLRYQDIPILKYDVVTDFEGKPSILGCM